ncbi:MAG: hypothetical protein ACFE95_13410 [Candidatus Hodarchaeota archaeon]
MGYIADDSYVRVDFFKPSGKWYTTESVKWTGEWSKDEGGLIHDEFAKSLRDHFASNPDRLSDMIAICLKPYHELSHPILLPPGMWNKEAVIPDSLKLDWMEDD